MVINCGKDLPHVIIRTSLHSFEPSIEVPFTPFTFAFLSC
jgi:hypothetical protein